MMNPAYRIEDFVTLTSKRGIKASTAPVQELNLYRWLRSQGFGQCQIGGKTVFYQRAEGIVKPSSVIAMRYAFLSFLEHYDFPHWPPGIGRHELLEWFYGTRPPRQNQLFMTCLYEHLSEAEVRQMNENNISLQQDQLQPLTKLINNARHADFFDQPG